LARASSVIAGGEVRREGNIKRTDREVSRDDHLREPDLYPELRVHEVEFTFFLYTSVTESSCQTAHFHTKQILHKADPYKTKLPTKAPSK
jgi:hypothetical protein